MVYLMRKAKAEEQTSLSLNNNEVQNIISANVANYSKNIMNALEVGINNIIQAISLAEQDKQLLEQNVHITAEFPDAKDAEEIKLALKNLTNRASQYIGNNSNRR